MNEDPYLRLAARHKALAFEEALYAIERFHDTDGGITETGYQLLVQHIKGQIDKWKEVSE